MNETQYSEDKDDISEVWGLKAADEIDTRS